MGCASAVVPGDPGEQTTSIRRTGERGAAVVPRAKLRNNAIAAGCLKDRLSTSPAEPLRGAPEDTLPKGDQA